MRYFFITQDTGLSGAIRFRDFDIQKGGRLFTKADSKKLNDSVVLYLSGSGKEARPDFIQNPVTMCSYRLKDILEAYEDGIEFKDVVMIQDVHHHRHVAAASILPVSFHPILFQYLAVLPV